MASYDSPDDQPRLLNATLGARADRHVLVRVDVVGKLRRVLADIGKAPALPVDLLVAIADADGAGTGQRIGERRVEVVMRVVELR